MPLRKWFREISQKGGFFPLCNTADNGILGGFARFGADVPVMQLQAAQCGRMFDWREKRRRDVITEIASQMLVLDQHAIEISSIKKFDLSSFNDGIAFGISIE
ncbi:hypothetical protein EGT07_26840 [Herbaspirillum sp. HC18]|nr:hypothetical protein EGT07_26840 [Herbaspirillum sp. HC18]